MAVQATSEIDPAERAAQARVAALRFKQTIFGGVGAAFVFGLVNAACGKLLPLAGSAVEMHGIMSMAAVASIGGIVAIGAIGFGCIYLGSRLLSLVVTLEHEEQARKIHEGAKGRGQEITVLEPVTTPTTGMPGLPDGTKLSQERAESAGPRTTIDAATSERGLTIGAPLREQRQA